MIQYQATRERLEEIRAEIRAVRDEMSPGHRHALDAVENEIAFGLEEVTVTDRPPAAVEVRLLPGELAAIIALKNRLADLVRPYSWASPFTRDTPFARTDESPEVEAGRQLVSKCVAELNRLIS